MHARIRATMVCTFHVSGASGEVAPNTCRSAKFHQLQQPQQTLFYIFTG